MERLVYVVQLADGKFIGTKRFTYKRGKYSAEVDTIMAARIFTRPSHAMTAAPHGARVLKYKLTPTEEVI